MPQDTLSFTLQTATGSDTPPPPPPANGMTPYGHARIPITLRMTLPPELLDQGEAAQTAGPNPVSPDRFDGPSADAEHRALGSLFAGPSGFAPTTGSRPPPLPGPRAGGLSPLPRARNRTTPSRPAEPEGTDPGFTAFQAGPGGGERTTAPVPGLPPLPGPAARRPPVPSGTV